MRLHQRIVLVGTMCIVAATALVFPNVTGYGTILYQIVVLGAWRILASFGSGAFADTHHQVVWLLAGAINLIIFLVPEVTIWFAARKRWPGIFSIATCAWCGFYLLCLFFLFPATDGP